jgi:hypothetical protein
MSQMARINDPQIAYMQAILPQIQEMYKAYTPAYTEAIKTAQERLMPGMDQDLWQQVWDITKRRTVEPYRRGLTEAGEMFAGKGTLRSGEPTKTFERFKLSEAQALGDLATQQGVERYKQIADAIQLIMSGSRPPQVGLPGIAVPQQQTQDYGSLGETIGMLMSMYGGGTTPTIPSTYKYGSIPYVPGAGAGGTW